MKEQHPITPPPELVQQWFLGARAIPVDQWVTDVATQAARWGADQQLAEAAKWLDHNALNEPYLRITPVGESLKEAMRPKPPSLKEQALLAIDTAVANYRIATDVADVVRRALEQLDD